MKIPLVPFSLLMFTVLATTVLAGPISNEEKQLRTDTGQYLSMDEEAA